LNNEIEFENSQLSPHIFQKFLIDKSRTAISEKNIKELEKYLEMILNFSLGVNKDIMKNLFNGFCELKINNGNIYNLFATIIRKASLG
jgi:hypothetical protein